MSEFTLYGIEVPTDGSDNNVWGGILNDSTMIQVMKLSAGVEPIALSGTSGSITSTNGIDNQYRNAAWNFSDGGITGPYTLTIPGNEKLTIVNNPTTKAITFNAGGTTASLPAGHYGILLVSAAGNCTLLDPAAGTGTPVETQIHAATSKTPPVDADELGLVDSAASNVLKKLTWANLKAALNSIYLLAANVTTTAQYLANTASKVLTTDQVNASGAYFALTDGATISWDMASGFNASVTIGGNRTFALPTNMIVGRSGVLKVTQDGTGSRTGSFASGWKGTLPTLSTTAGAVDCIAYVVLSTSTLLILGILKAV